MYGKTYKLHNSPALAPAEVLLVLLHDDIKFFYSGMFLPKVIKETVTAR